MDKPPFAQTVVGSILLGLVVAVIGGVAVHRITETRRGVPSEPVRSIAPASAESPSLSPQPSTPVSASKAAPTGSSPRRAYDAAILKENTPGSETDDATRPEDLRPSESTRLSSNVSKEIPAIAATDQNDTGDEVAAISLANAREAGAPPPPASTSSAGAKDSSAAPVEATDDLLPSYDCDSPMTRSDFVQAARSVRTKSFEHTKLTTAKQIARTHCMRSEQVRDMMSLFTFENSKLEFAKFAWHHVFDPDEYFVVGHAFTFSSSIDTLNAYIERQN